MGISSYEVEAGRWGRDLLALAKAFIQVATEALLADRVGQTPP